MTFVPEERPDQRTPYSISNNMWDREDFNHMMDEVEEFSHKQDKLIANGAGDLGFPVWQDLFLAMWKAAPEMYSPDDVRASHLINHAVMQQAMELPEYESLRVWTQGDDVASVMGCITMEPDMETLYDRTREAQKQANELEDLLKQQHEKQEEQRDVEDIFKDWSEDHDPEADENQEQASDFAEQQQSIQDALDELAEQIASQQQSMTDAFKSMKGNVQGLLSESMERASEAAKDVSQMGNTWGSEPGEVIRLPAAKRIALAKRMNSDKFRRISELFGSMDRFAAMCQKQKVDYMPEEIFDMVMGDDLTRVLPSRLAEMSDPELEDRFWADFAAKRLPMYDKRGEENVSKGGIIYIHDGSSSMAGDQEIWAKSTGLCLLHIARKQGRPFIGIQFGSRGQIRVDDFSDYRNIDPDLVIDFAEYFMNGGTDFESPLSKGVELLQAEFDKNGAIKSDIVFATDGECSISDDWFRNFKEAQDRLHFRVWGIAIGATRDAVLRRICDDRVSTIKDLTSGEDIAGIFGGV